MIGLFDSGCGGLTVAAAIRRLAPQVDLVYFGDTTNAPYGTKTDAEILHLTMQCIKKLRAEGATTIVSACNSVSASVIRPFFELFDVRDANFIEMVGPAITILQEKQITNAALLATPATIRSGMYQQLAARQGITLHPITCPTLAGLIENGADILFLRSAVQDAITQIPASIESVLLGCTHYPLIQNRFEEICGSSNRTLTLLNPAPAVAEQAIQKHGSNGSGITRVICSKQTEAFREYTEKLLLVIPRRIS